MKVISSLILCSLIAVGIASSAQASPERCIIKEPVSKHVQFSIHIESPVYDSFEEDEFDPGDDNPWTNQDPGCQNGLNWVSTHYGRPFPYNTVGGGFQPYPPAKLYVCRAFYNGGMHPGKLYNGHCNIGWGGNEVVLNHYQVLVSHRPLHWVRAGYGAIPYRAVQGGYQHDGPLYVCRTKYQGGLHIGKIVGENCNIGWGGKEVCIPVYDVLTR